MDNELLTLNSLNSIYFDFPSHADVLIFVLALEIMFAGSLSTSVKLSYHFCDEVQLCLPAKTSQNFSWVPNLLGSTM